MTSETGVKSPNEFTISKEQKEKISDLLTEISRLTNLEKWYLHLKLPSCPVLEELKSHSPSTLSSSNRVSTTLNWIQTHYVEDRRVCVPKQEIYNQYRLYCDSNGFNPVAIADFGKIVKTIFPNVHDRRLGQRGKSKYCYGGLRKKSTPGETNSTEAKKIEYQQPIDPVEELESLSSQLVCEWASCLLGKNFPSTNSLAQYLVFSGASCGKKAALFNMLFDDLGSSTIPDKKNTASQLQDSQALVQRKLLQKEVLKEHKNLLKLQQQQTTNQRDVQATQSTFTRLAVLSPNITFSHSNDMSMYQPSTLHVLNLPFSLESPAMGNVDANKSGTTELLNGRSSIGNAETSTLRHSSNDSVSHNVQNIAVSAPVSRNVNVKPKSKQSKLISSKSLEDGSQRQPKRNSDFLHNTNQGVDNKRRRCITSLGMTGLQGQSIELSEENWDEHKEAVRMRPFSCPVFYDNAQTLECDMESEDIQTSETCQSLQTLETPDPSTMTDNSMSSEENRIVTSVITTESDDNMSKASNGSNSFHFVRKPTVISIKPPDKVDCSEPIYANVNSSSDSSSVQVSPVKKSHHILNSILSSSDSNLPQYLCAGEKRVTSFTQPLQKPVLSDGQITKIVSDGKDSDKYTRREAHTLDNAYLLPCQSSRSAFVRVMNGKGHSDNKLDLTLRPRHLSFDDSVSQGHKGAENGSLSDTKTVSESQKNEEMSDANNSSKSTENCGSRMESGVQAQRDKESTKFQPVSVSVSPRDRCPSTIAEAAKVLSGILTSMPPVENILTSSKYNTSDLLMPNVPQMACENSPVTCQSKRMTSKSPVTPPKRQSKSRFTPIRPKIGGSCNLSPQKTDMRPVATILKEQRARSAQELLVNLASNYQGGIKVQLPAELLGLSSPDKNKSDVVVSIGNGNKPDPTVKGAFNNQQVPCQSGKDITVILEPASLGNPSTTQSSTFMSPQKVVSSSTNVTVLPSASSTVSNLLSRPLGSEASTVCISSCPSNISSLSHESTTSTVVKSASPPLQSQVIVADAVGTMYSLDSENGKPLPKISSLQKLLQASTDNTPSGTPMKQNIINVSDIKGHVVGPDAMGQTYLLVPNTESATLPMNVTAKSSVSSMSSTLISSPSIQTQSFASRLTPNLSVSSSSALLSELSHLASVSNQDKSKQPIQHDSSMSAFQKCEPNKATIIHDQNSKPMCDIVDSDFTKLKDVIQNQTGNLARCHSAGSNTIEHCDVLEFGEITVRKRKASKGHDEKLTENKRQNTKNTQDDISGMDAGKTVLSTNGQDELVLGGNEAYNFTSENKPTTVESEYGHLLKSCDKVELSDTEALLNMISDSRSMTVKETVMAMNSLKAQMKKSLKSLPKTKEESLPRSLISKTEVLSSNDAKSTKSKDKLSDDRDSAQVPKMLEKVSHRTSHAIKRNTSLNLESLESDALLDTELLLDHRLVEEMKCYKNGKSDHKTSVAVAAKTPRSVSADRKSEQSRKTNDLNYHATISPKALRSFHVILSEKGKSCNDKESNSKGVDKTKVTYIEKEFNLYKENQGGRVIPEKQKSRPIQRRSISSVQDILKRGTKPVAMSGGECSFFKSKPQFNSSEVDAFDALLSKMHSKQLPNISGARSQSSLLQDSEIPVDIVDFVTESMTSRKNIHEGNSGPMTGGKDHIFSYQSSKTQFPYGARSVSVPNTKPDFFDFGQFPMNSSGPENSNPSLFGSESHSSFVSSTEVENPVNKNVFLSPVGPAKLARRSSVEKSAQSQIDRSMTKTPVETFPLNSGSHFTAVKEKPAADMCGAHKIPVNERRRTKTPVDKNLQSDKHRAQTPVTIQQPIEKGQIRQEEHIIRRSPVNRSLAKTPIEKFFMKQASDPMLTRSELLSQQTVNRREDPVSVQTPTSDSGSSGGSVSQTPNSDFGRSSVSQTPISDFGYNSVSPSPVMMSSSTYFGECGRNLSPATIFMPLRSDSALSLSNNTLRSESPACTTQSNQINILPGSVSDIQNDPLTNTVSSNDIFSDKAKHEDKDTLLQFTSDVPDIPSFLESLSSKALFPSVVDSKDHSLVIKSSSDTKTLMKLLSSSLQNIPTPPVSPTSSPPMVSSSNSLPLPFSIPVSPPLPHHDSSSSPPSTLPCFLLPISSSGSSSSTLTYSSGRQFSLSPHSRQDIQSPAIVARGYTPSPQILARPPSSPHQYSSHPSPPFTPCSLRSLPSPRCLTPSSHKSMISPRSVTPSSDPNQAPNRFMPIQSSGVLPTSMAPTHSYIQPIKPVVALASASSHGSNADSVSKSYPSVTKENLPTMQNFPTMQSSANPNSQGISSQMRHPQNVSASSLTSSLSHSSAQRADVFDVIRTSEHKPLEANSTLVLSLSGDIGSFSSQGVGMSWGSNDLHKDSLNPTSIKAKQSDFRQLKGQGNQLNAKSSGFHDHLLQFQRSEKSSNASHHLSSSQCVGDRRSDVWNISSQNSHHTSFQSQKSKAKFPDDKQNSNSTSLLKLLSEQPNSKQPDRISRLLSNTPSSTAAFKPAPMSSCSSSLPSFASSPSSSSSSSSSPSSVCSFKPVLKSSTTCRPLLSTITPPEIHPTAPTHSTKYTKPNENAGLVWSPNQALQHHSTSQIGNLCSSTQDELQVTLDVLKNMDSHYFQHDEDVNTL